MIQELTADAKLRCRLRTGDDLCVEHAADVRRPGRTWPDGKGELVVARISATYQTPDSSEHPFS